LNSLFVSRRKRCASSAKSDCQRSSGAILTLYSCRRRSMHTTARIPSCTLEPCKRRRTQRGFTPQGASPASPVPLGTSS